MGQVKRFEMEMARRFPEQENVGGCRYFGGGASPKQERRGVRQMRLNVKPEKRRRTAA